MKKHYLLISFLALIGGTISAQSATDPASASTSTPAQNRFEATIICMDAVEAPTKYNAFAKPFIQNPSFPVKAPNATQVSYQNDIDTWLTANPQMVSQILVERKKAHDILYGPRPY